jgi:hypothetical protein
MGFIVPLNLLNNKTIVGGKEDIKYGGGMSMLTLGQVIDR